MAVGYTDNHNLGGLISSHVREGLMAVPVRCRNNFPNRRDSAVSCSSPPPVEIAHNRPSV